MSMGKLSQFFHDPEQRQESLRIYEEAKRDDLAAHLDVDAREQVVTIARKNLIRGDMEFEIEITTGTTRLADLLGAQHSYFTAPLYAGSAESRDTIMQLDVFRDILERIRAVDALAMAAGDLSKKITVDVKGEILELKNTINTMVDQLRSFASEVTRVAREVGTEGKLGGQADVKGVSGTWKDLTDNVNQLAGNLTAQVRAIAEVSTAVTRGDLTRSITVEAEGEVAALKNNINQMINFRFMGYNRSLLVPIRFPVQT